MTVAQLIEELKKRDPKAIVKLSHSLLMNDYLEDFSEQGGTCQEVDRVIRHSLKGCGILSNEVFVYSRFQKLPYNYKGYPG